MCHCANVSVAVVGAVYVRIAQFTVFIGPFVIIVQLAVQQHLGLLGAASYPCDY
jgi:hypothetical protein